MVPGRAFWQRRHVFLTGHTGFKGSWLAHWLLKLGADVTGFSDTVPTSVSLFDDLALASRLIDVRGDIRDAEALNAAVKVAQPDLVLHLAAQPLVRLSYSDPVATFATNVMGTVNVLEAARKMGNGLPTLIVTTDKCYENREWLRGYREHEAMGGHDPYSASKGCAELVTAAYARSFINAGSSFKTLSARAGNVIGGGDWATDRLVPDLVRGFVRGETVGIRNPGAIRPWQHVLEPLCGYLLLAERMVRGDAVTGQGWNFGPNSAAEVSVGTVADTLCRLWGNKAAWHFAGDPGQLHEATTLRLDSTKARTLLNWSPRWSLERALHASVEIYRAQVVRDSAICDLVNEQIDCYAASSE